MLEDVIKRICDFASAAGAGTSGLEMCEQDSQSSKDQVCASYIGSADFLILRTFFLSVAGNSKQLPVFGFQN